MSQRAWTQTKSGLSQGEIRVLQEIARLGGTNAEAGEALGISPETVRRHLHNINQKLGSENRVQMVVFAMARGIVPCACGKHE